MVKLSANAKNTYWNLTLWLLLVALGITPCLANGMGNITDEINETTPAEQDAEAIAPDEDASALLSDEGLQQGRQSRVVFVPGDAVFISAFPDTSSFLNGMFPIDDRGYVELPLYGKAKISHMSREQFINFLRQNFQEWLRYPNLYVKPLIRVSVLGAGARPGILLFRSRPLFLGVDV